MLFHSPYILDTLLYLYINELCVLLSIQMARLGPIVEGIAFTLFGKCTSGSTDNQWLHAVITRIIPYKVIYKKGSRCYPSTI